MEAPAAPLSAEEVRRRLAVLKSFADETKGVSSARRAEVREEAASLAEKFAAAMARVAALGQGQPVENGVPVATDSAAPAQSAASIYDELITELSQESIATGSVYLALAELLPHLTPQGTVSLTTADWKALSARLPVEAALSFLITSRALSFPYKRFDFGATPEHLFGFLQKYAFSLSHDRFDLSNHRFTTRLFPFTFDDRPTLLVARDEDYELGDKLVDFFQEECRMRARRSDERLSPLEYWLDRAHHAALVQKALGHGGVTPRALREALYASVKECTQFKPSLVVSVIRLLRARRVLDFSAGWGDRLVGAIAAGVDRYVATDPNVDLKPGHDAIRQAFCPDEERRKNFEIIYEPFERAALPSGATFDLVFTSPPFFDFEIYTQREGQSVMSFPRLNDWLVRFLFFSLRKSWERLETGGHMVIHIADVYKTRVCEAMNLYCQSRLQGARYRGLLACSGGAGRARPMWVWRREERSDHKRADEADRALRRLYPDVHELVEERLDRVPSTSSGSRKRERRDD